MLNGSVCVHSIFICLYLFKIYTKLCVNMYLCLTIEPSGVVLLRSDWMVLA